MIAWTGMLMFKSGITTPMEDTWCTQRYARRRYLLVSRFFALQLTPI
jgi:hypothetical protein